MSISCLFGHKFVGCKCARCGKVRNEGHVFEVSPDVISHVCQEKCKACGEKRVIDHQWNGCQCARCFALRDEGHQFQPVQGKCEEKCSICGKTRPIEHQWNGCKCARCGAENHVYERVPDSGKRCCIHCGKSIAAYDLRNALEAHEIGALVTVLDWHIKMLQHADNGADGIKLMEAYKARIEKNDTFTKEELCNLEYASDKCVQAVASSYQSAILSAARSGKHDSAVSMPEVLLFQEIKNTHGKLKEYISRLP